jgi:hypothetical protein
MCEKILIERRFKADALHPPEFKDRIIGKLEYDFSSSIFSKEPFSIDSKQFEEKVSFKKP